MIWVLSDGPNLLLHLFDQMDEMARRWRDARPILDGSDLHEPEARDEIDEVRVEDDDLRAFDGLHRLRPARHLAVDAREKCLAVLLERRPMLRRHAHETLQDVLVRTLLALRDVVDRHPGDTVVLVAHDSVNRVILLHALGLPLSRYWRLGQHPCAINEIDFSGEDCTVLSMNETGHLKEAASP